MRPGSDGAHTSTSTTTARGAIHPCSHVRSDRCSQTNPAGGADRHDYQRGPGDTGREGLGAPRVRSNANPVTTEHWAGDAYNMPWRYMAQHPPVLYNANYAEFTKLQADAEAALIPLGVADASLGYYSPTNTSKGIQLKLKFNDGLVEILQGSRPLTGLDQLVHDWQSGGGEDIRKEYLEAMAAT